MNPRKKVMALGIVSFIIAASLFAVLYTGVKKNSSALEIPILKNDVRGGVQISDKDISKMAIGSLNSSRIGLILDEKMIVGKRAKYDLKAGSPIMPNMILDGDTDISPRLIAGGELITISSSLAKAVGGNIIPGDSVRISIAYKSSGGVSMSQPKELSSIKVVEISNKGGEAWKKANGDLKIQAGSELSFVTLEADEHQQRELLKGLYGGDIHLSLVKKGEIS